MVEQALVLGLGLVGLLLAAALLLRGLPRRARRAGAAGVALRAAVHRALDDGAARLARRGAALVVGAVSPLAALAPTARAVPAVETAPLAVAPHPGALPQPGHGRPAPVYVVRPGDCLWDIARRHLPHGATDAQVARAWPRWYAANRAVIGRDPGLLIPGTRLRVPDRRPTGTSSTHHPSSPRPRVAASSLDPDRR